MKWLRLVVAFLACVTSQAVHVFAQTGPDAGGLTGVITDELGAGLPDATIAVSGPALIGTRSGRTAAGGVYRIPALPPGEYSVVIARDGFQPMTRGGLTVRLGATLTFDATLTLATIVEQVRVEAAPQSLDSHSTAVATVLDAHHLALVPGGRSLTSIISMTPAVSVNRLDVGGHALMQGVIYGAFGTDGYNRPTIEGVDVTNIMGTGFTPDYGSLQEVSVGTGAHGPEWPKAGVQMQLLTKSGGNVYRGSLYADIERERWQSFNIDAAQSAALPSGPGLPARGSNRLHSYHDLNADIGGYLREDSLWWYSSFRRQAASARLVNFTVAPVRTEVSNYTLKTTYRINAAHRTVFYGQVGTNEQPFRLDPSGLTGLTATAAVHDTVSSTSTRSAVGWVWKADWNAVLGDALFWNLLVGQFGSNRDETPNGGGARFEDLTGLTVRGGGRTGQQHFRREHVSGTASYFRSGPLGAHHVKVGGEVYRTSQRDSWAQSYQGDVLHVLRQGAPLEVFLFETPSASAAGFWSGAAYLSDSWQLHPRWTLNAGLRWDRYRIFLPHQEHAAGRFTPAPQTFPAIETVIAWNVLAPRLGIIHDVTGDGRTLLKVNYARYRAPPGIENAFNVNPNSPLWWRRYSWADHNNNGTWDEGEQGALRDRRGGAALETFDPNLELTSWREVAASLERQLGSRFFLTTGFVWRRERGHFARQNATWPFEAFSVPVQIRDPGVDGIPVTADDGAVIDAFELPAGLTQAGAINVVRNVPRSRSEHWTWDVTAGRALRAGWSLHGGFSRTWNQDQANAYAGQPIRQNPFPSTPNDLINTGPDGRHEFSSWTLKAFGTYQAPWGIRVAPLLRHQSGQAFGRTFTAVLNYGTVRMLAEPIGSRRMDDVTLVDVRVAKTLGVGGSRASLFADVYNLFNANPAQNVSWSSGSFLRPLSILPPRLLRVGITVDW